MDGGRSCHFRHRGKSLIDDQADHHPDGEGAAAETEGVDLITGYTKISTRELVQRNHVTAQADAKSTAQNGQKFEGRGADAIVVTGDLVICCLSQARRTSARHSCAKNWPKNFLSHRKAK
jgi:hypothetical protein